MHHPPHAARYPLAALALALALPLACGDDDAAPASPAAGGATTTTSASGAGGSGATGGGGMTGCQTHADCTDADAAQCGAAGSCEPCSESAHCEGVTGLPVCDAGSCVACKLGEEDACSGTQTCDLLTSTCVDVAPMSVGNCQACTNDTQCFADHRCIPMEFESQPHGHYCLKDANTSCARPFGANINAASISGAAATDYCAIDEDFATCEAVNALLDGWVCETGMTDGMCGPSGMAEVAVPGALCRRVGNLDNQCTYACGVASECPGSGPPSTCGDQSTNAPPPDWCGG